MKALVRLGMAGTAALIALAPAPLAAQEAEPAPANANAIGPAQLRDFNLEGTIIRQAEPPSQRRSAPAEGAQPPAATTAQARPEPAPARSSPAPRTAQRSVDSEPAPAPDRSGAPAPAATAALGRSASVTLPPPSPADPLFSPAPVLPSSSPSAPYAPVQAFPDAGSGFSPLPWLIALLLLGGAGFYYFRRQRSPFAMAGAGQASAFVAPEPQPQPQPQPRPRAPVPAPAPAPAPPSSGGAIVSTRLRPWLDVRFKPQRLLIEADRIALEFEMAVTNSGSGPARDVLVEAALFNAGPDQDKEIGAFFARPVGQGNRVELLEPLKSMGFQSAVSLRRDQLLRYKAGDRTVIIPLIAMNVLYRGPNGACQTSVGFLIGKKTRTEKLAPFVLDQEPRVHAGLECRELETRVRK